jgi:hypothetical protein
MGLGFDFFIRFADCLVACGLISEYFDYRLRTNNGAGPASCALRIVCPGRKESLFVGFVADNDAALRARHYAKTATFASFCINNNFTCHPGRYAQTSLLFLRFADSNSCNHRCKDK